MYCDSRTETKMNRSKSQWLLYMDSHILTMFVHSYSTYFLGPGRRANPFQICTRLPQQTLYIFQSLKLHQQSIIDLLRVQYHASSLSCRIPFVVCFAPIYSLPPGTEISWFSQHAIIRNPHVLPNIQTQNRYAIQSVGRYSSITVT